MVAESEPRTTTRVGTLDRAVRVLDAVEGGARSLADVSRETGLTRSTAHRLLQALEAHGLLSHVERLGYALGPRLLGLAASATRGLPLREAARPSLERLVHDTGESAQLYVRQGDHRICVDAVESAHELRTIVGAGAALPLEKGSAGKVFLAWDEERTGNARGSTAIRRRGWAESHGEREAGVASVSAPILGSRSELIAVVSVSGPERRLGAFDAKGYAPAVVAAAREIEAALGLRRPA